jgi:DUF971 family protein
MSDIPSDIILHQEQRSLELRYEDGRRFDLPCEYLRVYAPSADVSGFSGKLVVHKEKVNIEQLEPVGGYAIRIRFDDGHKSGIYSWEYLAELGEKQQANWQDYLDRLAAEGYQRRSG